MAASPSLGRPPGPAAGPAGPAADPAKGAAARVAARYRDRGRFARAYVRSKLRLDPVHGAALAEAAREPMGQLLDLGCGRGQLGLLLLEAGLARTLRGVDWDGPALDDARAAARGLPAAFEVADLGGFAVPPCDTALLIDVLLQMPAEAQFGLLARVAAAARGRVLLRAFDPDRGWRSRVGWAMEGGLWASGRYRRAAIRPLPVARLAGALEAAGFAVEVRPCWGRTPLPNVLLLARRRDAGAGAGPAA